MRRIVLSILALLVMGSTAHAAEPLRIPGEALAPEGDLNVSPLEVEGGSPVTTHTILEVDDPRVSGDSYAVSGRVEYTGLLETATSKCGAISPAGTTISRGHSM